MASGSFISATGVNLNVYVVWSSVINIPGNYSTVYMDIYLRHYSLSCGAKSGSGTADGASQSFSTPAYSFGNSLIDTLMASKSFIVYHNADGTKNCGLSAYWGFVGTYGGQSINGITAATTVALDTIPRASSLYSATGLVIGGNQAITLASASAAFSHTIKYSFGSNAGTIISGLTGSTAPATTWNTASLLETMLQATPNNSVLTVAIITETYSGGTLIGTSTSYIYLTAAGTVIPTISNVTNEDSLQILGASLKTWYVQSKSKIKVLFQCAGVSGSTIVTRELKINGVVVSNALNGSFYEGVAAAPISSSSVNNYRVTVTDSRGRTATTGDVAITQAVAYSAPVLASCLALRCLQDGTTTGLGLDGTYIKITPDWDFSPVVAGGSARNAIVTKKWKTLTIADTTFTSADGVSFIVSNGTPAPPDGKFSINSSYQITVTLTDTLGGIGSATVIVPSAKRLFSMNAAGTGVAIGKAAEIGATNFEVDLDAKFNRIISGAGLDLTNIQFSYTSSALAATADKGLFSGNVLLGQIIDVLFTNGNTAASPTITIGAVSYTISGMPTTAKIANSANQAYKLRKTGATLLVYQTYPDYVCEYGTDASGWVYERQASGKTEIYGSFSLGTVAVSVASGSMFISSDVTVSIPAGLLLTATMSVGNIEAKSGSNDMIMLNDANTTRVAIKVYSGYNHSPTILHGNFIVKGTWK